MGPEPIRGGSYPHPAYAEPPRKRKIPTVLVGVLAVVVVGLIGFGLFTAVGALFGGSSGTDSPSAGDQLVIQDSATPATDPGEIVIGVNGDADTIVLQGEEYLEAGAHATDPTDGILNDKIEASGTVDTSTPGDYAITYRVSDSRGHVAEVTRNVHVVESMDTMQSGLPILMYHYIYTASEPPADLNANHLLDTDFAAQLQYLTENDFYYPSYPEVKAFLEGTHSLPAKSIVLTFDDGEIGFLNLGVPLLEQYQVPATSFVIASDGDASQRVVEHASPYLSFQSHSYNMHRAGGSIGHGGVISALSQDEILADLTQAQQIVGTTEAFAYPFGDYTADAQAAVSQAGILCAFTTKNSWASIGDDVTALPRVRISGEYSLNGFIGLVNES